MSLCQLVYIIYRTCNEVPISSSNLTPPQRGGEVLLTFTFLPDIPAAGAEVADTQHTTRSTSTAVRRSTSEPERLVETLEKRDSHLFGAVTRIGSCSSD